MKQEGFRGSLLLLSGFKASAYHSHAGGGAEGGEDGGDDACYDLEDELPGFFLFHCGWDFRIEFFCLSFTFARFF